MDYLIFERGVGGGRIFLRSIVFLTGQCFFTVMAVQEIFSQILPPPPSKVKWSTPYKVCSYIKKKRVVDVFIKKVNQLFD